MRLSKEELEKKIWYRILKILFILAGVFVVVCAISLFLDYMPQNRTRWDFIKKDYVVFKIGNWDKAIGISLITILAGFILLFIVKEIFFYIIYGKRDKPVIERIKKFLRIKK